MLLEFSMSNHRSFADEQTFSLLAGRMKDEHPERVVVVDGAQKLSVLTSAIIMGKNGSGKSSLVDALRFVSRFVRTSSHDGQQGEAIDRTPHKLDPDFLERASSFRMLFSVQRNVYQYQFSVTSEKVTEESLEVADKTTRFRKLFDRTFDPEVEEYVYTFGEALKGDKGVWRQATRSNALFFSTANQLNSEVLREPFSWLTRYFHVIDAAGGDFSKYTSRQCGNPRNKSLVIEFLRSLDFDVADIDIEEEDVADSLSAALSPEFLKAISQADSDFGKVRRVRFIHHGVGDRVASLELGEESTGTRALFGLAGPLFDSLANGYCLVVDEINTSIHPKVLHALVAMFSNEKINKKRAQLIFTSHDTSVLKDSFFRRDQIWFVDKGQNGKSELVPLSDYSPRKGEALDRGYLDGRYGGIPFISNALPLLESHEAWENVA